MEEVERTRNQPGLAEEMIMRTCGLVVVDIVAAVVLRLLELEAFCLKCDL